MLNLDLKNAGVRGWIQSYVQSPVQEANVLIQWASRPSSLISGILIPSHAMPYQTIGDNSSGAIIYFHEFSDKLSLLNEISERLLKKKSDVTCHVSSYFDSSQNIVSQNRICMFT